MQGDTPIVVVFGPTASGKTTRAIEIARERGGEVISADSRQVYQGFPVTTCRASDEEMRGIPHHLIGFLPITQVYSAAHFKHDADRLIEEIRGRGRVPIVAGGTYFYLEALLFEHSLPEVPADHSLRSDLEKLSGEELHARLAARDSRRAAALHPNDRVRLIRALEILTQLPSVPARERGMLRYPVEWVLLSPHRDELRARIETRVWERVDLLITEIAAAQDRLTPELAERLGLDFSLTLAHLRGERSREELAERLIARDWQYARRQRAWARRIYRTVTSQ
ncbi:tRNA (adenosine(37)-N6)-dimethylallyltransferase MiaA [Patescibacteria group bacterium]|jgi:tRNA dimethylallyltransferase|nr:tRNA (adenosine(37)-N6)-dimethylallyltransferase MiaA [Patescibacteria group bacterium]